VVAAVIWGSSFVAVKLGLEGAPPVAALFLRFAIAAAASTIVLRALGPLRVAVMRHPLVLALGLTNAVGFVFQYLGLAETNSAVAALLANIGVVVVALLSVKLLGERISGKLAAAVGLTFVGGSILATRGDLAALATPEFRGALLIAMASVIWSVFVVLNKLALRRGVGSEAEITWAVFVLSAVMLLPAVVLMEGLPSLSYSAVAWGSIVYAGVVCSSFSFLIYMVGLKGLSATVTAVVTVIEVIVAFVLTAVVFGILVTGVAAVGAALALIGIVLAGVAEESFRTTDEARATPAPPSPRDSAP
jgi:drug/metabolite transporter (DMT)-like permease